MISTSVSDRLKKLSGSNALLARCARGGAALAVGTVAERGARFVRNMILARLLAPDQFGLMAIVTVASQLFEALTEVGVRQSIIQNPKGDTDRFLNVAWWFSAVRGLALYLFGVAAAPWISRFYQEPALSPLLRIAFLTLLFSGLTSPRLYVLEKHLQFGRYVWITQGSGLIGTVVSLIGVIFIPNVWALVIGFVAEAGIRWAASFVVCPIRPSVHFDRDCSRELFAFARGMAGLPILTFVVLQADVFVLGRVCTKEQLGMYSLAVALANMPVMVFSRVAQPLIFPVLSRFQNDLASLRNTLLQITRTVFLFGLPMTACLAVFGRAILSVVYGRPYGVMAVAFGLLCGYFLVYMAGTVIASTYMAIGRPELHRRFMITWAVLVAILIVPAAQKFGPSGAAGTLLICLLLASAVQILTLGRIINLSSRQYLLTADRGIILAGVVAVLAGIVRLCWNGHEGLQLLVGAGFGATAWAIAGWWTQKGVRLASPASLPAAAGGDT